MSGFFNRQQTTSRTRPDGKSYTCVSCGLYKNSKTPRMKPYGRGRMGIMNIGEAPGRAEDKVGLPWQGSTGQLLKTTYKKLGVDLFEDCVNINAVNCRPPHNQTPTNFQIDCCRNVLVQRAVEEFQPKVIVLLGNAAVYSFLGHRWVRELGGITRWRGWVIPDQQQKCWVCPVWHPSFVQRSNINGLPAEEYNTIFQQDLQRVVNTVDTPWPRFKKPVIHYIDNLNVLKQATRDSIAFDYETTGLKPHAVGHRIVCGAVATDSDNVYTFMMPPTLNARKPLIDLLTTPHIGKRAHNIKFEDTWTAVKLRTKISNWEWDSMLAAHLLDNRQGITGLKFQMYVNFGVDNYSSDVDPYLKGTDAKDANTQNRVQELLRRSNGQHTLLKYCALDAVYEYRLSELQTKTINYSFLPF